MSGDLSGLDRMRRELGEANSARLSHQTAPSSMVSSRGGTPTASLERSARRNLYILASVGVVNAVVNPVAADLFASGRDWFSQAAVTVLTWPVAWLQPVIAAMGALTIGIAAIRSSGFQQVTPTWARATRAGAIVAAVSTIGLVLVSLGLAVAIAVVVAGAALMLALLFSLMAGG